MRPALLDEIRRAVHGRWLTAPSPDPVMITEATIDTRNAHHGDLFIAIGGETFDGHDFLTQAAANWMIEQRKADPTQTASVINVSSISALVASVNRGDYCLTKAAIGMATQLWAVRLAEFGIPVYEVRPGVIRTDMTSGVQEKYDKLIAEGLTLEPRWGTPEDVGKAVATLARGDLPYATGQVINVDGGLMIQRL